ncbi:MAG: TlyA family RNA methyltransferase [Pseudomonadota bacterium]|nr:TlyA family RNA methyltransferase [Pseudomonadota bacterium]
MIRTRRSLWKPVVAIYKKNRLDQLLVRRGLARSRAQARDLVIRGEVRVDGVVVLRPAASVGEGSVLDVDPAAAGLVSRGGEKLAAALDAFGFDASGRAALDLGASTGGFTQVLLQRGAAHVTALDVGHGQLAPSLAGDPRVTALEKTDARDLVIDMLREPVTAITADLSFISLVKALEPAMRLAAKGAWLVALVKPQFEAGREAVGKGGVVRDPGKQQEAVAAVSDWVTRQPGWTVMGVTPSPIEGGSGNREFLLGAVRDG